MVASEMLFFETRHRALPAGSSHAMQQPFTGMRCRGASPAFGSGALLPSDAPSREAPLFVHRRFNTLPLRHVVDTTDKKQPLVATGFSAKPQAWQASHGDIREPWRCAPYLEAHLVRPASGCQMSRAMMPSGVLHKTLTIVRTPWHHNSFLPAPPCAAVQKQRCTITRERRRSQEHGCKRALK